MKTDLTGRTLGHYKIHRRLGKGGMGEVYLAHDVPLDRPVALKVVLATWAHDASVVERFHREARAAAKLSHPNIVQIYTVGTDNDVPYFAMEYVEGMPLDKLLKSQGPMPWQRVLQIVGQVASALEAAHAKGIIHRDIKPANILIDRQGRARVTDFGVAKVLNAPTRLTTDGSYIGTPQYMSPEQCGMGEMSPASDLFSLGVTAFEMLTGTAPFEGDTPATLIRKITQETPRPLNDLVMGIPQSVCQLVHTMLEKETVRRYKNPREVMSEISRIIASGGADVVSLNANSPAKSAARSNKRALFSGLNLTIAGVALVLCVSIVILAAQRARIRHAAAQPNVEDATVEMPATGSELPFPDPRELFIQRDTNKNGLLEDGEVPVAARSFLMRADTNNDHAVNMDEYMAVRQRAKERMAPAGRRTGQSAPKLKPVLAPDEIMFLFDKNLDGTIAADEIPPQFSNLLRVADSNRDGALSMKEIQDSRRPKR